MKGRAYAQIGWSGRQMGVRIVNPQGGTFFIYAKYALRLQASPDTYILVKKRDRNPAKAVHYHGGEIIGLLEHPDGEPEESSLLTLYFGEVERRMQYQEDSGKLLHVMEEQRYCFPRQELALVLDCLALMAKQKDRFEELYQNASNLPGGEILFATSIMGEGVSS